MIEERNRNNQTRSSVERILNESSDDETRVETLRNEQIPSKQRISNEAKEMRFEIVSNNDHILLEVQGRGGVHIHILRLHIE
jgi:hypothetical protein